MAGSDDAIGVCTHGFRRRDGNNGKRSGTDTVTAHRSVFPVEQSGKEPRPASGGHPIKNGCRSRTRERALGGNSENENPCSIKRCQEPFGGGSALKSVSETSALMSVSEASALFFAAEWP